MPHVFGIMLVIGVCIVSASPVRAQRTPGWYVCNLRAGYDANRPVKIYVPVQHMILPYPDFRPFYNEMRRAAQIEFPDVRIYEPDGSPCDGYTKEFAQQQLQRALTMRQDPYIILYLKNFRSSTSVVESSGQPDRAEPVIEDRPVVEPLPSTERYRALSAEAIARTQNNLAESEARRQLLQQQSREIQAAWQGVTDFHERLRIMSEIMRKYSSQMYTPSCSKCGARGTAREQ